MMDMVGAPLVDVTATNITVVLSDVTRTSRDSTWAATVCPLIVAVTTPSNLTIDVENITVTTHVTSTADTAVPPDCFYAQLISMSTATGFQSVRMRNVTLVLPTTPLPAAVAEATSTIRMQQVFPFVDVSTAQVTGASQFHYAIDTVSVANAAFDVFSLTGSQSLATTLGPTFGPHYALVRCAAVNGTVAAPSVPGAIVEACGSPCTAASACTAVASSGPPPAVVDCACAAAPVYGLSLIHI